MDESGDVGHQEQRVLVACAVDCASAAAFVSALLSSSRRPSFALSLCIFYTQGGKQAEGFPGGTRSPSTMDSGNARGLAVMLSTFEE